MRVTDDTIGVIFHGPAGNGKTISIKALMHSLYEKSGDSIPSLYVKSAPRTWDIRSIFVQARAMSPCLLILEDIDTIVTPSSRSYFFNEVDGLENNDGIFMVASTNHLDQLDPGLSSRPSRFDRKYLFPNPSRDERALYCDYWREKLKDKPSIKFPKKLCDAIAGITDGFSFAYLKEAFVATLLVIAGNRAEESVGGGDDEGSDLDEYELWREMKKQVKLLRDDMDTGPSNDPRVQYHKNLSMLSNNPLPHLSAFAGPSAVVPQDIPRIPAERLFGKDLEHRGRDRLARQVFHPGGHQQEQLGLLGSKANLLGHAPLMADDGAFLD